MNNLVLGGGLLSYSTIVFCGLDNGQVAQQTHLGMCKVCDVTA